MEGYAQLCISAWAGNARYSADEVGGQQGSDLEQGMQIAEMCQNIRSHDSDGLSWPSDGTSWADISPGWDALGVAGIPEATGAGGLWSGCVGHDAVVAAACPGAAGADAVAAEHLRGGPAVEFHQVALGPAAVEPGVAEVVPEPVRMHPHPALMTAADDHLMDAMRGHRSPLLTPSHSWGRQAWACRERARMYRSMVAG